MICTNCHQGEVESREFHLPKDPADQFKTCKCCNGDWEDCPTCEKEQT